MDMFAADLQERDILHYEKRTSQNSSFQMKVLVRTRSGAVLIIQSCNLCVHVRLSR